jgi:hypothetical protein
MMGEVTRQQELLQAQAQAQDLPGARQHGLPRPGARSPEAGAHGAAVFPARVPGASSPSSSFSRGSASGCRA